VLEPIGSGRLSGATVDRGMLLGQRRVLELMARGRPLSEVLETLCLVIEEGIPGAVCSVLLLDPSGKHLQHAAAPHLPHAYCEAINGSPIGPSAGSCGTAAYRRSTVIVTDIATDPLWTDYRAVALEHGLAACASVPISHGEGSAVLGTFAIYHDQPGSFASTEIELLRSMTGLAAIAIVTRLLLSHTGGARAKLGDVELNALLSELLRVAASSLPRPIALQVALGAELPTIRADSAQIKQMVEGLISNAVEAIGEASGTIRVRTYVACLDQDELATRLIAPALHAGTYAVLEVVDSGSGMSRETVSHMFEPFFSTKPAGHGLGLSNLLSIVKGHGGGVEVESELGQGATFRLFLPLPAPRVPLRSERVRSERAPSATGGPRTVLLVDDDVSVRGVVARMLMHLGYTVLQAGDGLEAIETLEKSAAEIDLVLMDVRMPRMDARATLPHLSQRWPRLPVVLSSGDENEGIMRQGKTANVVGFLPKPYRVQELAEAIERALGPGAVRNDARG